MLDSRPPVTLPPGAASLGLSLAAPSSIIHVAAFAGRVAKLAAALGVALPDTPRRRTAGGVTWLWSGVQSWVALSEDADLHADLTATAGSLAAIVDQSHGRTILHLTSPRGAELLGRLVPIDLHPTAFAADATALTLAGPITVQLWRLDGGGFALSCFTSFAQALTDSILAAFEGIQNA